MKVATLRFVAWLARRRRAADDRTVLAGMSDRDLQDIGLTRRFVDAVETGAWTCELLRRSA
jgi:uncharacterized protein YjiS (DUF1127 family)